MKRRRKSRGLGQLREGSHGSFVANPYFRDMFDADPAFYLRTDSHDPLLEMIRWTPMRSCIRPIRPSVHTGWASSTMPWPKPSTSTWRHARTAAAGPPKSRPILFLDGLRDAHAQGRPDSPPHLISSAAGRSTLASGNPNKEDTHRTFRPEGPKKQLDVLTRKLTGTLVDDLREFQKTSTGEPENCNRK